MKMPNRNCDSCTVQWTWYTANSCNPAPDAYCAYLRGDLPGPQGGWMTGYYASAGYCQHGAANDRGRCSGLLGDRKCCSEVFTNCADVHVSGADGASPTPAPTPPSPPPSPPAAPTPSPEGETQEELDCNSCKQECYEACGSQVQINQCWGEPRYIQCQCSDGSTQIIPGCKCEHSTCPGTAPSPTPDTPAPEPEPETTTKPNDPEPEPEPETTAKPDTSGCQDKALTQTGWTQYTCAGLDALLPAYCAHSAVAEACCKCQGVALADVRPHSIAPTKFSGLIAREITADGSIELADVPDVNLD